LNGVYEALGDIVAGNLPIIWQTCQTSVVLENNDAVVRIEGRNRGVLLHVNIQLLTPQV
jgi:hypothetical protein